MTISDKKMIYKELGKNIFGDHILTENCNAYTIFYNISSNYVSLLLTNIEIICIFFITLGELHMGTKGFKFLLVFDLLEDVDHFYCQI